MKITIGIADDHQLFLKSLSLLISSLEDFTIIAEGMNGKDLINKLEIKKIEPDIILLDVNMPVMDGRQTAEYLSEKYPAIKLVALSMKDDDATIISMIKAGCCSYLLKDIHPEELNKALLEINKKGYYNSDAANINYRRLLQHQDKEKELQLTDKEKEFLQLACSDATYKQIAATMHVSERTVDGYRENLFKKLNVQSRTGMALEAIRRNFVSL
ncbi:response regulator [Parafilimonas terrae]|uniref:Two component transcriptional regulator, LuxR family n=1 Tax=Parafilimonas terrae TaxID=1465490 RepID=A0A1I5XBC8_9BACT|nr:response regulator transcription factor [Parafilimonas terrae]SFQ29292.1 two component transcriptional regulator, LuxR family [Parafilimonas terrae]